MFVSCLSVWLVKVAAIFKDDSLKGELPVIVSCVILLLNQTVLIMTAWLLHFLAVNSYAELLNLKFT